MIKKFTNYVFLGVIWFSVVSCDNEEIVAPPKPTLTVDQTSGLVGDTKFTFTVSEVDADAISLLPYGEGGDAGIQVTNFANGVATVEFSYGKPGTFQAIVVSNNHSSDGEEIANVKSDPVTVTIASDKSSLTAFRFIRINETATQFEVLDVSTETEIDQDDKTIIVEVPYGTDITTLRAAFTASPFSTVSVGGAAQTSEETANNFSSPVVYRVTANDGTTTDYTVTVNVTPVETETAIKSITATAVSTNSDDKALGVAVDNTNHTIVVYDELGTPDAQFDSVRIGYELEGTFAILKFGDTQMDQDSLLDLTDNIEFEVYSQDSINGGIQTYDVFFAAAPKLALSFPGLNPDPADGVEPENFEISISALGGTDVENINTVATTTAPVGITVNSITANGDLLAGGVGTVDYSEPVKFELTVTDVNNGGITYVITYTVSVTVVP